MGEIDRLSLIVDELLILSRAGEHELPAESVDLRRRRRPRGWSAGGTPPRSAVDRARGRRAASGAARAWCARPDLDRSIDALVENALRYSPARLHGDDRGRRPAGSRSSTEGPGLAPGEEEAVFERFRRGSAGPQRPERHRPRAADRPRAGPPVGRRGDALGPRGRWDTGGDRAPAGARRSDTVDFAEALPLPVYGEGCEACQRHTTGDRVRVPAATRWTGLALLGMLIAAAVSIAASRLASQQIGLASEPISAGDALAPAQHEHRAVAAQNHRSKNRSSKGHRERQASQSSTQPSDSAGGPGCPRAKPARRRSRTESPSGDGEHGGGGADD